MILSASICFEGLRVRLDELVGYGKRDLRIGCGSDSYFAMECLFVAVRKRGLDCQRILAGGDLDVHADEGVPVTLVFAAEEGDVASLPFACDGACSSRQVRCEKARRAVRQPRGRPCDWFGWA